MQTDATVSSTIHFHLLITARKLRKIHCKMLRIDLQYFDVQCTYYVHDIAQLFASSGGIGKHKGVVIKCFSFHALSFHF